MSRKVDAYTGCYIDDLLIAQNQMQLVTDHGGLCVDQLLGQLAAQENRKLVPAQASYNIACPGKAGEDPPCLPDGLVACPVAQRVVDLLEVVQIHNEQRAGLFRCHCLQTLLDGLLHGRPVQKP